MLSSAKAKRAILADPRVLRAWDEHDMGDGVWVSLKAGYQDASNPGSHSIHEDRWTAAYAMLRVVVPCHCVDCRTA